YAAAHADAADAAAYAAAAYAADADAAICDVIRDAISLDELCKALGLNADEET
ncbi:MAG: hypothetical protein H0U59_04095, partial [Gemmatimonadaceae bacterium]|nr:hypothetical protein [Gemmatimonadaceae bacterium]